MAMRGPKLTKYYFIGHEDFWLPDYWWSYPHQCTSHAFPSRLVGAKKLIDLDILQHEFADPRPDDDNTADWLALTGQGGAAPRSGDTE